MARACGVAECDRPYVANGLCDGHRQRLRDGVRLDSPIAVSVRNAGNPCEIDWCERQAICRGLCGMHNRRRNKGTDMDARPRPRKLKALPPGMVGCIRCDTLGGQCEPHRKLLKRYKLTAEQYAEMLLSGCAVCGRTDGDAGLSIDHDHACCPGISSCGRCVRGLLCTKHNMLAGFLESEDAPAVQKYLDGWSENRGLTSTIRKP